MRLSGIKWFVQGYSWQTWRKASCNAHALPSNPCSPHATTARGQALWVVPSDTSSRQCWASSQRGLVPDMLTSDKPGVLKKANVPCILSAGTDVLRVRDEAPQEATEPCIHNCQRAGWIKFNQRLHFILTLDPVWKPQQKPDQKPA